jgi:hypothetical protein
MFDVGRSMFDVRLVAAIGRSTEFAVASPGGMDG